MYIGIIMMYHARKYILHILTLILLFLHEKIALFKMIQQGPSSPDLVSNKVKTNKNKLFAKSLTLYVVIF